MSRAKPFNITVIQAYGPTNNTEEIEVESWCSPWGCKDLGMGGQLNWTIILFSSLVGEQIVPLPQILLVHPEEE